MAVASEEIIIKAPVLRGANFALGACRDIEVCLDGPAGTGKTVAALFKVHILLSMYPGSKALIARKTNTALAGSAIASYRDMIDVNEGITYFGGNKIRPAAFEYPNGSVLVVNGLDKRDKIKSWEFDIAYINEASECDEEDIEYVRMRLRHGKTPYHQLIMDTNPDAPTHWLNVRMNNGITTRLVSRHEDNPRYYDAETKQWTAAGLDYIFHTLEGLTGVLYARYRLGKWVAAEGTVYEDSYDRARNVVNPFAIPKDWPRYMVIDFGYANPFVCKWYAVDPDGRLYCYREIYKTKTLVEDHAKQIASVAGWHQLLPKDDPLHADGPTKWADPLPRAIICDHDAEDRATLERHLHMFTLAAKKTVSDGIQAVASRLRVAGDNKPRMMYFCNALVERDPELVKKKLPTWGVEEFDNYVWDTSNGAKRGETPVKRFDHSMDCDRYMAAHLDLEPSGVSVVKKFWG